MNLTLEMRAKLMEMADQYLLASVGFDEPMFQQERTCKVQDLLALMDDLRPWKYALSDLVEPDLCYTIGSLRVVVIHPEDEQRLISMLSANRLPVLKLGEREASDEEAGAGE